MTIEQARARILPKPWGVLDLRPWRNERNDDSPIGEIWYERSGGGTADSGLLLKLLFTSQALSIQVHPDDASALSMGLPRGKAEAWYVLSASLEAKVALGLKRYLTQQELREAIDDGSIPDLVAWEAVSAGDTISVPAGTIHAIGKGLVIAEIQQRSDATFRLFDHGRGRELHIESAISVADAEPAQSCATPQRLSDARTLLVSNAHFVFEKIDLLPRSAWRLEAKQETWLLVVGGSARAGSFDVAVCDAVFAQADLVDIQAGTIGLTALVAYTGIDVVPDLLRPLGPSDATDAIRPQEVPLPISLAVPADGRLEASR